MKIKAFITITIFFSVLSPMRLSHSGQETFTIYTKDWQRDGYAVERKGKGEERIDLYNKDWTRRGYVKKEGDRYTIYDKNWERKGYIKGLEGYEDEKGRR